MGVDQEWAAAAILPSGAMWLAICVQRGALAGAGALRRRGRARSSARRRPGWRFGVALYAVGLGVTGAFLGTAASLVVVFAGAAGPAAAHAAHGAAAASPGRALRLRDLLGRAWIPILGFTLLAALQNIDIVYVKREIGGDEAGSYAAASVAAKAVIWIAIGLGLYLLPEAVKRTRTGGDARPVLAKTLGLIAVVAVPMIMLYAFFGEPDHGRGVRRGPDRGRRRAATARPRRWHCWPARTWRCST